MEDLQKVEAEKLIKAVDEFADEMKTKLLYQLNTKGYLGWDSPNFREDCGKKIMEKAIQLTEKQDTDQAVDLANYVMFYKNLLRQL